MRGLFLSSTMDAAPAPARSESAFAMGRLLALDPLHRERLHRRTLELARKAGRVPPDVAQADYEQAKRELVGELIGAATGEPDAPARR
jgi:hypothetical protein